VCRYPAAGRAGTHRHRVPPILSEGYYQIDTITFTRARCAGTGHGPRTQDGRLAPRSGRGWPFQSTPSVREVQPRGPPSGSVAGSRGVCITICILLTKKGYPCIKGPTLAFLRTENNRNRRDAVATYLLVPSPIGARGHRPATGIRSDQEGAELLIPSLASQPGLDVASRLRRQSNTKGMSLVGVFILAWIALGLTSLAALLTHVIVCIKASAWLFLIAGAIAPPIGVVHGVGLWFGAW